MKYRKILYWFVAIFMIALCTACGNVPDEDGNSGSRPYTIFSDNNIDPLINKKIVGISEECKNMLMSLTGNDDKNCIYSPASLVMTLQLLEKGASGNTYSQIHSFVGNNEYDLSSDAVDVYNFVVSNGISQTVAKMKDSYKQSITEDPTLWAEATELTLNNKNTLASELNKKVSDITNGQISSAVSNDIFNI